MWNAIRQQLNKLYQQLSKLVQRVYEHPLIHPWAHPIYTILFYTITNYSRHRVFRLGAALGYYTIFSLPAIIIVVIGLVGFFFGEAAVRGEVYTTLIEFMGEATARQVQNAVISIGATDTNWWATVLGISFLIFVATGVFYALQEALNQIFEVEALPRRTRLIELLINRVLSLSMVLSVGGLLIVSIILNALLLKVSDFISLNELWVHQHVPDFIIPYLEYLTDYFLVFLNLGLSVFLVAFFFSLLYKILPAVQLKWRYIWAGAFFAAILFWLGQLVMGIYLSRTSVISAYGAAGSVIVILIWVSYSSQLIFLGAEFIIACCHYNDVPIIPKKFAIALQNNSLKNNRKRYLEALQGHNTQAPEQTPWVHHEYKIHLQESKQKHKQAVRFDHEQPPQSHSRLQQGYFWNN